VIEGFANSEKLGKATAMFQKLIDDCEQNHAFVYT
jgi:hypothetical protein